MWARIDTAGRVAELTDADPGGRYHPDITWVPVAEALRDHVRVQSWQATAGQDGVEPESLSALIDQLGGDLAAVRYGHQTAGVLHDGRRWHSDGEGRSSITDSLALATEYEAATGESWTAAWKTMDGYTTVDRPALVAAGLAVGAHVSACFSREAAILTALETAATAPDATAEALITAYETEITAGWPTPA